MRIAFIGLGNMGGGMAANLAKAGHEVRAFDLSEAALAKAEERGAFRAADAAAACEGAEAVVTMLPAGKHVAEVYRSAVFGNAPTSAIMIDCSTIDVATARTVEGSASRRVRDGRCARSGRDRGGRGRAPSPSWSADGGGLRAARPILEQMGKAVIHAGGSGSGQAAKIVNNMLLASPWPAPASAFVLAQKLGLDPQVFFDISRKASGQSWSMTSYCPVPGVGPETRRRGYEGGFAAQLMLKDLTLAMEAAQAAGAYTPMGGEAEELYRRFVQRGGGPKDFSAIIKMIDDSWTPPADSN
jgi:3-hydroxyisobutyrate dehydrogenase